MLQTIVPEILLVLVGFCCFILGKDKFPDRLRALIVLLFPTYAFQYTINGILPKTYGLLAPHYLVFVSMITMVLLIAIASVSYFLVDRQNHVQWCAFLL